MSKSTMVLHAGGELVTLEKVKSVSAPAATKSWFPVKHIDVLERTQETLAGAGYSIEKATYALSHEDNRFFCTMDLTSPLMVGVALAVGVRNSTDKTFPLGFCAGSRVFICDNLAFSADLLVKRKHTRHGERDFGNRIADAVSQLALFRKEEERKLKAMCATEMTDDEALATMVRAVEKQVISGQTIPKVLAEWRTPTFDYGTGDRPTAWKLFNCFTTVLGDYARKNPSEHAGMTIRLNNLLAPRLVVLGEPTTAA